MKKNDILIGTIETLGVNGEGIIKIDGYTVFLPFALPNEKVEFKVLKVKGNVAYAKLIEVKTPSISRLKPRCEVFSKCGGCQLQHLKYIEQLKAKTETVKNCLSKIAFLNYEVPLTVASKSEYGYRNKLQLPIREQNGEVAIGFFAPNSHRVIDIKDCPIQPEWCKKIISIIKRFINENGISVYDEETGEGLIKHLVVREVDKRLLITVVINGKTLKNTESLIHLLKDEFKEFSLYINVNEKSTNAVFGESFICVFGKDKIKTNELGVSYEIGPQSFMQVNDSLRGELYKKAFELSGADKETAVIDAYSGAGLMTALFAQRCKKAIGIEIVKEAVDSADELKKFNGIENMENVCAPCEEVLPSIMERERKENGKCVLILDPPRQGVDYKVIEAIEKSLPDKIVYISCSPQSLSRDLGLILGTLNYDGGNLKKAENLKKSAYRLTFVQPFDLFPQTKHVETVVLLERTK